MQNVHANLKRMASAFFDMHFRENQHILNIFSVVCILTFIGSSGLLQLLGNRTDLQTEKSEHRE